MSRMIIEPYPHQLGGHCGSGALRDLLHWARLGWDSLPGDGLPSEGLVFGLGGGLSFMYTRYSGLTPPIYLVGRNGDMELDLCRRLNIQTRRQQTDDPDQAWHWVKGEIDAGRPVMVWCDIAELPYLRVKLSNTRHDVVVIGYDEDRNTVLVVDNDREEVQEVPMDAFRRAHGSRGFPGPNRFATYPMHFPDRLPDLLTCAREAAASARGDWVAKMPWCSTYRRCRRAASWPAVWRAWSASPKTLAPGTAVWARSKWPLRSKASRCSWKSRHRRGIVPAAAGQLL